MTIPEMHVWFRQYAQQMGMQNVRAILPEQIDLLINTSISDTINQIFMQNIGMTNDRVITDNSKIGQINALRSLYKVKVVPLTSIVQGVTTQSIDQNLPVNPEQPNINSNGVFKKDSTAPILRLYANIKDFDTDTKNFEFLYLVDFAINYTKADKSVTNYFPVRLIDDAFLADTLNDFILRPRLRSPISVVYNGQLDLYIDDLVNNKLPNGVTEKSLRVSYIAKPRKVAYVSDLGGENVDCDLPPHMHVDILKHAVDLYRISVSGALSSSQQQEQSQQRENARNNYRNEGAQ